MLQSDLYPIHAGLYQINVIGRYDTDAQPVKLTASFLLEVVYEAESIVIPEPEQEEDNYIIIEDWAGTAEI